MNIKDEMDENTSGDMVLATLGVLGVLVIVLGAVLLSREQSLRCIELMKDKPTVEIMVVCE